jgi:hypothetical protein
MLRFAFTFFVLLTMSFCISAQVVIAEQEDTVKVINEENTEDAKNNLKSEVTDVIYQHDGTKLLVDVKKIYLNDLYYSFPGETKVNKMDQRLVHKIEYKSGKVEVLNETPQDVREVGDYRKVKVTKDPDDVEGLIEVAKLEAIAEGSERGGYTTQKTLERSAIIVLRRKAALVNADIILITDKKTQVAFGELPKVTLYGTAYSYR